MKKSTIAAAAAAIALSSAASAHEFACEKTVDGAVVRVVGNYPATLHFKVVLTNTHPDDKSIALAVRDEVLEALGVSFRPVPFTLDVGQSVEFSASVTVKDQAGCLRLSQAPACATGSNGAFQVVFDGGVTQCAARLVCLRDEGHGSGGKEDRR
jgi:hypothetical protein